MATIRRAVASDRDAVVAVLRSSHAAAQFPFAFSAPHADRLFQIHIADPAKLCLVLDCDGRVRGILMAHVGEHWFGAGLIASETVWFIEPEYRGPSAIKMMAEYEAWAAAMGCSFVAMAMKGNDPKPAILYQRRGYAVTETHFWKPV